MSRHGNHTLIIGVGNHSRGDDAVGRIAALRLRQQDLPGVRILETTGEPATLMDAWKDADRVVLIDAAQSGAEPGTIHRFDAHSEPLPARIVYSSTHAFGVAEAIELSRALDRLPSTLVVFGIEGSSFEPGHPLSPEAESALDRLLNHLQSNFNR